MLVSMIKMLIIKIYFLIDLLIITLAEGVAFLKSPNKNANIKKLFSLNVQNTSKILLIVSVTNLNYLINMESLFAKYFNEQGYRVFFLTSPRNRAAISTFNHIGGNIISQYFLYLKNASSLIFENIYLPLDSEELKNYTYNNINIGTAVYALVCRRFKIGKLDFGNKRVKRDSIRFLLRSIIYAKSAEMIMDNLKPDLVLANEKGYVGSSEIFGSAINKGIDFIQWVGCPKPESLVFKRYNRNNTKDHPHSISKETWAEYTKKPWDNKYAKIVSGVFKEGYEEQKWFRFNRLSNKTFAASKEDLIKKFNLDPNKKIAVLFAHVMWDANLFYGQDIFKGGFEEWYIESVKAMAKNTQVNWLIKIHPANRFKHKFENIKVVYREISAVQEVFGALPENIKFIYPEDEISPYSLFKFIDYGITVRGTIGSELPCFGVPTLTAGTGRYSGLGFTNDSATKEEYLNKLSTIESIPTLSQKEIQLANLHAYLFFKVRPKAFDSFKEVWQGADQDIKINIVDFKKGLDFMDVAKWADTSKNEDLLNEV